MLLISTRCSGKPHAIKTLNLLFIYIFFTCKRETGLEKQKNKGEATKKGQKEKEIEESKAWETRDEN